MKFIYISSAGYLDLIDSSMGVMVLTAKFGCELSNNGHEFLKIGFDIPIFGGHE